MNGDTLNTDGTFHWAMVAAAQPGPTQHHGHIERLLPRMKLSVGHGCCGPTRTSPTSWPYVWGHSNHG
eukprot:2276788-Karenia_brevis.AAC.1